MLPNSPQDTLVFPIFVVFYDIPYTFRQIIGVELFPHGDLLWVQSSSYFVLNLLVFITDK